MDQIKTGNFIRDLRKEKELTQEQFAEQFGVSRRTVSRWETGSNMPDLDILIDLSDYFEVDLREILDGERKDKKMNKELEETVIKVAEYSNEEKRRTSRIVLVYFVVGLVALVINSAFEVLDIHGGFWIGFIKGMTDGLAAVAMIFGILFATGKLAKVQSAKKRLVGRD